jgi:Tol biopolymer transport system component
LAALLLGANPAAAQKPNSGTSHMGGGIMYHAPHWSPDGRFLLVSANLDDDAEIYRIRADGTALRQLKRNMVSDDMARWSADGQRMLFESERSGAAAQYSMNLEGGDVRPERPDSVVSRSPDGATLLFESVRGGHGRLFLMTSSRTNAREIPTAGHAEQGRFSPDGRWIVFEQRAEMHRDIPKSHIVRTISLSGNIFSRTAVSRMTRKRPDNT